MWPSSSKSVLPMAMDAHHGRSQPICRYSIQFCTIPTGDQPPSPSFSNGSSPDNGKVSTNSSTTDGTAGGSGMSPSDGTISLTDEEVTTSAATGGVSGTLPAEGNEGAPSLTTEFWVAPSLNLEPSLNTDPKVVPPLSETFEMVSAGTTPVLTDRATAIPNKPLWFPLLHVIKLFFCCQRLA